LLIILNVVLVCICSLQLYNSALVVRLVLTWFPNPPAFIEQPLA
jgi:hypothetical protein